MFLKYVQIVNFRNLKDAKFCFAEGANTIIGENDAGKSNAVTAMRILLDSDYYYNTKRLKDNDFHPIEAEERVRLLNDPSGGESEAVPAREITIGMNCFIGCNSIILKGTELGDNCVVGAGAVVSGKFPE